MERIFQYTSNTWFRGQVPTSPTPQGWASESPVILTKQYSASEQQFQASQLFGIVPPPPVVFKGWMSESPLYEIFIKSFNVSEQQFSSISLRTIPLPITTILIIIEDGDVLTATFTVPPTIPATARINGIGYDNRGSPIYWYIDTATGLSPVDSNGKPINPW
jgi:hypothetical protein